MAESKRRVLIFLALLFSISLGFFVMNQSRLRATFHDVCNLVEDRFFQDDDRLREWVRVCRARARLFPFFSNKQELLNKVQDTMDLMEVSHFFIYSPTEDEKLWRGSAIDNGLRSRWMEDHMIVYQVLPNSAAAKLGLHMGDEIIGVNGKSLTRPDEVGNLSGTFTMLHDGEKIEVDVVPSSLLIDAAPHLTPLDKKTALVEISSFREEYFEKPAWTKLVTEWSAYPHIILDLRENAGGNFAAMLRALSPLFCTPTLIGTLEQPRKMGGNLISLADDLKDLDQIRELGDRAALELKTFSDYGCYKGRVTVLVGPNTASVAEIFAHSAKRLKKVTVAGLPTAGDVLLAVWYEISTLGPGYSLSIPEAIFLDTNKINLEARGVDPGQTVYDDLKVWRSGRDSTIEAVRR